MNPKIFKKLKHAGFYTKEEMERFLDNPPIPTFDILAEKLGGDLWGLRREGTKWSAFRTAEVGVAGETARDALGNLWLKIFDK